ncbi:hypothetical protein I5V61_06445 [Stenotrophomonas maltophilia]|uniref:hypothetical protein n=1 Tax=Stenotrophomonas geniculata TaxID=86188 RepID=UPI0018D4A845|nr:hypothetical protein [Stenotrophomonas maltophilia]
MSTHLDVLAVMERAFDYAVADRQYEDAADMHNARAAVAELIEATVHFKAKRDAYADHESKLFRGSGIRTEADRQPWRDLCKADSRLDTALARVKGEAA